MVALWPPASLSAPGQSRLRTSGPGPGASPGKGVRLVRQREYEVMYIISREVSDEAIPQVVERVNKWVADLGGEVTAVDEWGRRRLAYPIRKFRDGYYVVMRFRARPDVTTEFERNMRLAEDILRHLLVRVER